MKATFFVLWRRGIVEVSSPDVPFQGREDSRAAARIRLAKGHALETKDSYREDRQETQANGKTPNRGGKGETNYQP